MAYITRAIRNPQSEIPPSLDFIRTESSAYAHVGSSLQIVKRKAEYRSDRAQEEMRNLIDNANSLIGGSTFWTESGSRNIIQPVRKVPHNEE